MIQNEIFTPQQDAAVFLWKDHPTASIIIMKFILTFIFLLAGFQLFAQSVEEPEIVFTKVEVLSGPDKIELQNYLAKNSKIRASDVAHLVKGRYEVKLQLVIDVHGNPGRFKMVAPIDTQLYQRAVTLLKKYPGPWRPASQCGRLVNSYWNYTVVFKVN